MPDDCCEDCGVELDSGSEVTKTGVWLCHECYAEYEKTLAAEDAEDEEG